MILGEITDKQPDETFPITVEFDTELASGETIASAVVTATNMDTGETSTATVLSGSVIVSSPDVTQKVTAGAAGSWHRIEFTATTTNGNVYQHEVDVRVSES